jgi:hypothetical protein
VLTTTRRRTRGGEGHETRRGKLLADSKSEETSDQILGVENIDSHMLHGKTVHFSADTRPEYRDVLLMRDIETGIAALWPIDCHPPDRVPESANRSASDRDPPAHGRMIRRAVSDGGGV